MTENDTAGELSEASLPEKSSVQRSPRTVRFSDAERQKIENAAARCNRSPAAFIRNASLADAADPDGMESGTLPPGIGELIKRIYRSTYMLSTLKRDEMIRVGRAREMNEVVRAARNAQEDVIQYRSLRYDPPDA